MSVSLKLEGGDLKIGGGRSLETVSGVEKLAQDLQLLILERIGTDPATPTYGSALDGGIINGALVPSMIGQIMAAERVTEARGQVLDLLQQYQIGQLNKIKQELVQYSGRHTLDPDEVIQTINNVDAKSVNAMTVVIRASISTLAGSTFNLTIPVAA